MIEFQTESPKPNIEERVVAKQQKQKELYDNIEIVLFSGESVCHEEVPLVVQSC